MNTGNQHDLLARIDRLTAKLSAAEKQAAVAQKSCANLQAKLAKQRAAMATLSKRHDNARAHITRLRRLIIDATNDREGWRVEADREVGVKPKEKG